MIEAILFDLDGTIVDTWRLYVHSYLVTFEELLGRKVSLEELRSWKPVTEIRVLRNVLGEERFEEAYSCFLSYYTQFHGEIFEGVYYGILECLQILKERNFKLGIVTGKSKKAYEITSKEISFQGWDFVVCDEDVKEPKPSPEGILFALEKLNTPPQNAIYVGDSIVDLYAANSAGVRFAGALWPKSTSEKQEFIREITSKGASILLQEPKDLIISLDIPC